MKRKIKNSKKRLLRQVAAGNRRAIKRYTDLTERRSERKARLKELETPNLVHNTMINIPSRNMGGYTKEQYINENL